MNVLLARFNDEIKIPIIKKLYQQLNIERYVVVSLDDIGGFAGDGVEHYIFKDVKVGLYDTDWSFIPPLDDETLRDMAFCEAISIKMMERIKGIPLDYDNRKRLYIKHLRFWKYILESRKIDLYIASNVPHEAFNYIIYCLCKKMNIKTLFFYCLPVLPKKATLMYLCEDIETQGKEVMPVYNQLCDEYQKLDHIDIDLSMPLKSYLNEYSGKEVQPYSHTGAEFNPVKSSKVVNFMSKAKLAFFMLFRGEWSYIFEKMLHHFDVKNEKYDPIEYFNSNCQPPDYSCKYIYFPLHFQPEASTSPSAGVFVDQALICQMLSYLLPDDVYIYVKEHPRISKNRNIAFYDDFLSVPNVRFIAPEVSTFDLIENSSAVATATGTVGWEAFFRKKPVLMFGHRIYQYAPGVYRIKNIDECKKAIEAIFSGSGKTTDRQIILYLKALESFVFESAMNPITERYSLVSREQSVENMTNALLNKIDEISMK